MPGAVISGTLLSVIFLAGTFIGTFASTGNIQGAGYAIRCLSSFRSAQFDFTIGGLAFGISFIVLPFGNHCFGTFIISDDFIGLLQTEKTYY